MTEKNVENTRFPAYGNLVAKKITDREGEGLIIEWINSAYQNTIINSDGDEVDMYNFVKNKYPDLSEAAGAGFAIDSDELGFPIQIGEINGEPVKLRKKDG